MARQMTFNAVHAGGVTPPTSTITSVFTSALAIVLTLTLPIPVFAEEDLTTWYQVDVILFKPRTVDLNEESWPESTRAFPADMVAIAQGEDVRPFLLSQLEQIDQAITDDSQVESKTVTSPDTFLFENLSRGNRNRRTVEALVNGERQEDTTIGQRPNDRDLNVDVNPETGSDATTDVSEASGAESPQPEGPEKPTFTAEPINLDNLFATQSETAFGHLAFEPRADESSLLTVLRSLNRSSRFDVLTHQSWVQPINNKPTPILIQTGQRYDDTFELEGTLSFSRSRFLHVQSNLRYTIFEPRFSQTNPYRQPIRSSLDEETLAANKDLVEVERERGQYLPASVHNMAQSRRMRSGELHYIDHPMFGVIVRINRHTFELGSN
jgi:hypothetical protein